MGDQVCAFLLGANTKDGFVSFFDEISDSEGFDAYIIKSGPGCGKSTLMTRIAHNLRLPGERIEYIRCSSDPDSLDGVLFHDQKLAVLDGTSPHVLEPRFPGASGDYITAPPLLDRAALRARLPELSALAASAALHYRQAFRYLGAAHVVGESIAHTVSMHINLAKLQKRTAGIIAREIPKTQNAGRLRKRFLDGITPQGRLCFFDTVDLMAGRVYEISDEYGFSHHFLQPILREALARGHEVYACFDLLDTSRLRHLILPGLSLAFVSSGGGVLYGRVPFRRIRVDGYVDYPALGPARGKIKLMSKIAASLLFDACEEVKSSKLLHDQIEQIYRPHLDIASLEQAAHTVCARLLADRQGEGPPRA